MSSRRLQDKVCIITGASSGIGRAIAQEYAKHGAKVVCADLASQPRAEVPGDTAVETHTLINQAGGEAIYVKTNVTIAQEVENLVHEAVAKFGRVDVLVNSAGVSVESRRALLKLHETPEEDWDQTMSINLRSIFLCAKYVIGQMMKQEVDAAGDRGWIINLSSIYGLVGAAGLTCYATAKGAIINLTRTVALDYAPDGIHCNAICPGYIKTAIYQDTIANHPIKDLLETMHPLKGTGKPQDIVGAAVFLASGDASWITGQSLAVDGGFTIQ